MPQVPVFDAGGGGLQIPEGGAAAFQQVGRRSGEFFRQFGEEVGQGIAGVGQVVEQHDVLLGTAKAAAAGSGLQANLLQGAQKAIGDHPEDSTAPQKYLQSSVEPALQDYIRQFDGAPPRVQEYALGQADSIRKQVSSHVAALGSFAAGQLVEQTARQTINNLGQATVLSGTAQAFADNAKTLSDVIDNLADAHPNLSAEDRIKMKTSLMQQAQEGWAKGLINNTAFKNPDQAMTLAADPRLSKYVNATETNSFIKQVAMQKKSEARADAIFAREAANQQAYGAAFKFLSQDVTPNADGTHSVAPGALLAFRQALSSSGADKTAAGVEAYKMAVGVVESAGKQAFQESPEAFSQLKDRALLPPSDPNYLSEADALKTVNKEGGLSTSSYMWMKENIYEPRRQGGQANLETDTINDIRKAARARLVPTNGLGLEAPDQTSYLKWDAWFGRMMSDPQQRQKILQDPASALSPDVVNQIGTPTGDDLLKQVQGLSGTVAAPPTSSQKKPIDDFMKGK